MREGHYLWQLRPYFRQVAGELVLGSITGILMNTMVVLPPILLGRAIDTALAVAQGQASPNAAIGAAVAFVLGTLATEVPRLGKRWWMITGNARIRANLRADALRGVLAWPMGRLHQTPVGDSMARIIGDIETLGVGVREFTIETWDTLLFSLSLVVAMLVLDRRLTFVALLAAPLAMLLAQWTGRWVRKRTTVTRQVYARYTSALQEHLAGLRVLRLFGRTTIAVERVAMLSLELIAASLAVIRLREGLKPIYNALMIAGVVPVLWLGGRSVIAGAMTLGAFVAYLELYLRFTGRAYRIPQMVNSIQGGGAAYARVRPLLAPALAVSGEPAYASFRPGVVTGLDLPVAYPASSVRGPSAVSLRHVTFRYPGAAEPALTDVSLELPSGSLVAVTGPVGCGKSALARTIVGQYPLEQGEILLENAPLYSYPAIELAARIGYLPQDASLFSGSVAENIAFRGEDEVRTVAGDALARATHCAALEQDLMTFPQGLDTPIGERGLRISGGQRQRIGLARALAAAHPGLPGLLVLDDPFSAVDVDTEWQIISALRETFGPAAPAEQRMTILLCSHRLAAFPQADLVVTLDRGRVAECGAHDELMSANGLYARIYRAQRQIQHNGLTREAA
jgi:ABC-type multidrug transport system fused ATPase/permease subunit